MWKSQVKPLATELWLPAMNTFLEWCKSADTEAEDRAVRRAFHLAMIAPLAIRRISSPSLQYDEIESLLETECFEQAAKAVLGANAHVEVSRPPETELWVAQFSIDDDGPACSEGRSPILAMLGAWSKYFT